VSEDERAAACALAGLSGIGSQSLVLIREAHGSLSAAVSLGAKVLANTPGLRTDGAEALRSAPDLAERGRWLLEKARGIGAHVLVQDDEEYPALLKTVTSAPPVLYVQGNLIEWRRVAVVGTREADRYALERTKAAVERLCAADLEVVSGGAAGVDAAAHQHALDLGGRTVAVIGTGLLKLYPARNRSLYERLAEKGAVISEFAMDAGGNVSHFPQRNRTMAALSEAVIITRGKSDSGALSTCTSAVRFGRPVFAVPGEVGDPLAAAPNAQLSAGARALVTGDEVLAALGLHAARPVATVAPVTRDEDVSKLPPPVRQIFQTLGPAPRHVDEIATEAGLPTAEVLAALLRLELDGLCAARPGKYFLRR
jgi:DNA processing protein